MVFLVGLTLEAELKRMSLHGGLAQFQKTTDAKEAIHVTLICGNGYKQGKYSGIVQNVVLGDDLFEE